MSESHVVFESVARYFSVLGEPTRLRILHALCHEERCVSDILKLTGLAQANASRHLGLMYQAGMLSRRRDANQIFYRVSDPVVVELCRSLAYQMNLRLGGAGHVLQADSLLHDASNTHPELPLSAGLLTPASLETTFPHPLNQKEKSSV